MQAYRGVVGVCFSVLSLPSCVFPLVMVMDDGLCYFSRVYCQGNVKHHLFEVQTEIVERLALEDGAGVFRLIVEHKVLL